MTKWTSPDGKIQKEVIQAGDWGEKPTEGSQCTITITDSPLLEEFNQAVVTIGDSDGDLWRSLDICLCTMHIGEESKFTLDSSISLVIKLVGLVFNGFIFEWETTKKYSLALQHKEKGSLLFKEKQTREAAFRFSKALKILHSIPIDVERPPKIIGGVYLADINSLKGILYNNLASCYYRNQLWHRVIELCNKVFNFDSHNVKALFRIGVAYQNDRNLEKAFEAFTKALEIEPGNKICTEHLNSVKEEMRNEEKKVNMMVKKMFTVL